MEERTRMTGKRRVRLGALGMVAAIAAAALVGATARQASAGLLDPLAPVVNLAVPNCGAMTQPFAGFGDYHDYYAIQNNGFESGATGWTLSGGARVVDGNEPYGVNNGGASSLYLPSGSSALGPAACINVLSPYLRFFAQDSGSDRGLTAQVLFYGLTGNLLGVLNLATLAPGDHRAWQPSSRVSSALALPLATTSFRLKLVPNGWGSAWRVDDVFVDPWVIGA
jgi:hypothetical protein